MIKIFLSGWRRKERERERERGRVIERVREGECGRESKVDSEGERERGREEVKKKKTSRKLLFQPWHKFKIINKRETGLMV